MSGLVPSPYCEYGLSKLLAIYMSFQGSEFSGILKARGKLTKPLLILLLCCTTANQFLWVRELEHFGERKIESP